MYVYTHTHTHTHTQGYPHKYSGTTLSKGSFWPLPAERGGGGQGRACQNHFRGW
jgi:hypothetical protein